MLDVMELEKKQNQKGLTSRNSENVLEMLNRVHHELGQTIVLITHDIDVAEAAERIVLMKDGVISP